MPRIIVRQKPDTICPDTALEINGNNEGTFAAGSTIELNLTDGVDPVTPEDVTVVGNVVTVEVPAGGGLATSLPIKTGQTVSFNDYDDGEFQFGRLADPNTLDEPNVFGNLNRFTAVDGSQTYDSPVVFVDHSTQQKDGSIIWYTLGQTSNLSTQLSFADGLTRAGKSDWRMCPIHLYENLRNLGATRPFTLTPFAPASDGLFRSASRTPIGTTSLCFYNFSSAANHSRVVPEGDTLSLQSYLYRLGNISELT